MSTHPIIFDWIQKYEIKTLLNTPCASYDCEEFVKHGIEKVKGVNIIDTRDGHPHHVVGDLVTWKPEEPWDAAYINCLFCTTNSSEAGTKKDIMKNIASWPIRHILFYDTHTDYRWQDGLVEDGWKLLDSHTVDMSLVEVWGK